MFVCDLLVWCTCTCCLCLYVAGMFLLLVLLNWVVVVLLVIRGLLFTFVCFYVYFSEFSWVNNVRFRFGC